MTKPVVSGLDAEQGLLGRVFKLKQHGATARTEMIAGITTLLTMVYIVFVNPQILGAAGMDTQAVFVTTCLIAAFGSIFMGRVANLPVAPAIDLNAFYRFRGSRGDGHFMAGGDGGYFLGCRRFVVADLFPRPLLDDRQHPAQPADGYYQWHRFVYRHDRAEKRRYGGSKPGYASDHRVA